LPGPQTPPAGRRQKSWDLLDQNAIALAKQQKQPQSSSSSTSATSSASAATATNQQQQQQQQQQQLSSNGAKVLFKTQRSFSVPTTRDQRSLERHSGGLKGIGFIKGYQTVCA